MSVHAETATNACEPYGAEEITAINDCSSRELWEKRKANLEPLNERILTLT